jgi:hypothetical protein
MHPKLVVNLAHAGNVLGDILGQSLGLAAIHVAAQGDLSIAYANLNLGGVDVGILGETFAKVFIDAIIRAAITFWPAAGK